jgi:hypothetical protein
VRVYVKLPGFWQADRNNAKLRIRFNPVAMVSKGPEEASIGTKSRGFSFFGNLSPSSDSPGRPGLSRVSACPIAVRSAVNSEALRWLFFFFFFFFLSSVLAGLVGNRIYGTCTHAHTHTDMHICSSRSSRSREKRKFPILCAYSRRVPNSRLTTVYFHLPCVLS